MSSRLLRDEVMTIFLAGHDTTAAVPSWMWLLLGLHRDADSRLQAELSSSWMGGSLVPMTSKAFPMPP